MDARTRKSWIFVEFGKRIANIVVRYMLNYLLKNQLGFQGFVMSDWSGEWIDVTRRFICILTFWQLSILVSARPWQDST